MKKYQEFVYSVNEATVIKSRSGKNYVEVYNEDTGVIAYEAHKDELLIELQALLNRKERGLIKSVIVTATLPKYGTNRPSYLDDILPEVVRKRTPDDLPVDEKPDDINIFVDPEYEVIGLDEENNKIIGMPLSLKRKGITTPIDPEYVEEIGFHKNERTEQIPSSLKRKIPIMPPDAKLRKKYRAGDRSQTYNPDAE